MKSMLSRMPALLVAGLCAFWVLALITIPIAYARSRGWGDYWAFSLNELLRSLLFLFGPPALLILVWRKARKRSGDERAA